MFATPEYPIDCSIDLFKHRIELVDSAAPPPRRKLYPLSSEELSVLRG